MSVAKRSLNVGVVGLGLLGNSIARNLAFKSRGSVYLQLFSHDKTFVTEIADTLAQDGAQCAMRLHSDLSTVTKWSDVVVSVDSVAEKSSGRDVLLESPAALVSNARSGQLIIGHNTIDVETARECDAVARQRGAWFIDAPLCGSTAEASNGQLTIMVGAEEKAMLKALPTLRLYAENVHRVGDAGAGSAAKGICQQLVAAHTVAAAEAMTLASAHGIHDHAQLFKVLDSTWGGSAMLRRCGPQMERLVRTPEEIPEKSPMSIDSVLNNLETAALGQAFTDIHCPIFTKSHAIFRRAAEAGVGDRDMAAVVHFLESAGVDREATAIVHGHSPDVPDLQTSTPSIECNDVEYY